MATLYKRADERQQVMLRIVAGAVRNAAHAHGMPVDREMMRFARSVAKRAVGTLTAHLVASQPGRAVGTLSAFEQGELAAGSPDGQNVVG
jgi:hypothetical protein